MRKLLTAAAALSLIAGPMAGVASAQGGNVLNQQGGLVNVNVANVAILNDFLNESQIEILTNFANNNNVSVEAPITVQAPINVAAQVCGVAVNVLAQGGPSNNECTAEQGSQALADLVMRTVQAQ
jgi:hypothetical protein